MCYQCLFLINTVIFNCCMPSLNNGSLAIARNVPSKLISFFWSSSFRFFLSDAELFIQYYNNIMFTYWSICHYTGIQVNNSSVFVLSHFLFFIDIVNVCSVIRTIEYTVWILNQPNIIYNVNNYFPIKIHTFH